MTRDARQPAGRPGSLPVRHRLAAPPLAVLLVVLLAGAGVLQRGAFSAPWDLLLPGLAAAVAVVLAAWERRGLPAQDVAVVLALVLLAAWWWYRAAAVGDFAAERQVVGAAVGFAACFVVGRLCRQQDAGLLVHAVLLVGSASAVVGLVGLALRLHPLALEAQEHLRLAGTVTYSNGAAALLALVLVAGVTAPAARWRDPQLVLVVGALCATQSRGGVLAALVGLCAVRRALRSCVLPVALGVLLGVVAVAGSGSPDDRPLLLVCGLALPALSVLGRPWLPRSRGSVALVLVPVLAAPLGLAAASSSLREVVTSRFGTASTSDRAYEWQAGWRAFTDDPVLGRGPGLRYALTDGRSARFVHNEPLEVAADAGLVGLLLLAVALLAGLLRPEGEAPRPAAAATVLVLLVAGSVDFPWHLPALLMLAGLVVGGPALPVSGAPPPPVRAAQRSDGPDDR